MDELIEKNMGLVISIVKSFNPKNDTEEKDLIDAGRIGLWKALKDFDKTKGFKLSTYAWKPIRHHIIREIKKVKKDISINDVTPPFIFQGERVWECYTSGITEEEKQLIELRIQGYKLREMSEVLGQSQSSVKNKFYKLIRKLREANE